ncbi:MAG TPA: SusD/RagB family nutrient-binding outer membrane lipoprotein [Flavitalea sp.]|nr:SusD/RagB family nutrient-binding outer membrane lipoprotein [Flavitalea sp.]
MKYLKKVILACAIGVGVGAGCNTDELHNLNINPQALNTIDLNFLFTSAQLGAASGGSRGDNRYIDWRTNIRMCGYAIQHLAASGGEPGDKYIDDAETSSAPFEFIYSDQLKNIGEILKQSGPGGFAEGKNVNMVQAARILRAFLFHRLTDYYGSVPYFETMKAGEKLFFPHYDKQKDIYTDLLKELDEATASLTTADPADGFSGADLYYSGDISKWRKWGYSLMLRLAMRVSNVDQAMANTYVAKAVAGGVFTSNDDNVVVPMDVGPSLWTNQNGISRAFFPGDGGQSTIMSKTLIDYLKGPNTGSTSDDDPRLMIYTAGIGMWNTVPDDADAINGWVPTNDDPLDQKGMPNGKNQTQLEAIEGVSPLDLNATYSKINPRLLDKFEPYMLMNYGEVELLLAEAAARGIGGVDAASAETHYNAGVRASMQMWTLYDATFVVSDAAVDAWLAVNPYSGVEDIYTQLWVNKFLNWWDAWSDWRRTGFPVLVPTNAPGNVTGGVIPQKLKYPNAEVAGNPNFNGASANDYTTKVWWAGGPE